jgi:hypothetical protein
MIKSKVTVRVLKRKPRKAADTAAGEDFAGRFMV